MDRPLHLFMFIALTTFGCKDIRQNEYVVNEIDLVPEGISYSKNTDKIYLSSIAKAKIIVLDCRTGEQKDFISEHEFGFKPGAGILIDEERNLLYALCGYFTHSDSVTSLFTFDISTQRMVKRYDLPPNEPHFLNDLILDKKGTLYITDTRAASIYTLKQGSDSLILFFKSVEIQAPNGISISDDNTKLYVASNNNGVRIIDIATKTLLNSIDSSPVSKGIDGLEFYRGNLFAIQNSAEPGKYNFRKLKLNKSKDKIIGTELIDSDNPDLNVPLTFCIYGNEAIVIGNSNLQYLNQENYTIPEPDSLKNTRLLIYKLSE